MVFIQSVTPSATLFRNFAKIKTYLENCYLLLILLGKCGEKSLGISPYGVGGGW